MFEFTIPGKPIAQERPRIGKFGAYNPNSKEKEAIRLLIKQEIKNLPIFKPLVGPLQCDMSFHSTKPTKCSPRSLKSIFDIRRPDVDNFVKFYLDCMNGLVYEDDSQVVILLAKKIFYDKPEVKIRICQCDDN